MRRASIAYAALVGWVLAVQAMAGTAAGSPRVLDVVVPTSTTTARVAPPTSTTLLTTTTTTLSTTTTTTAPPTTAAPTTTRPAPTTTKPVNTTAPPPATTAPTGGFSAQAEAEFLALVNQLRAGQGVPVLVSNGSLNDYARSWSATMAATGTFAHSNISSLLGPWSTVGENIAKGGEVGAMFAALTNSSGHYANMVNAAFTSIGVGVWVDGSGTLWVTNVFAG